jgi:hypothetical protein
MAKRPRIYSNYKYTRELVASSTYGARNKRRIHLEMLGALAKTINTGKYLPV